MAEKLAKKTSTRRPKMNLIVMHSFRCRLNNRRHYNIVRVAEGQGAIEAAKLFAESKWRGLIANGRSLRTGARLVVEAVQVNPDRGEPIVVVCECRLSCEAVVVTGDELKTLKRDWPFSVGPTAYDQFM